MVPPSTTRARVTRCRAENECASDPHRAPGRPRRVDALCSRELTHLGFHRREEGTVLDRGRDRLDVARERAIVSEARRERADESMRRAHAVSRLEWSEKLHGLSSREQLDRERA